MIYDASFFSPLYTTPGRVPYHTEPPKDDAHLQFKGAAAIVPAFGAAFDAATMMAADAAVLDMPTSGGEGGGGEGGDAMADSVAFEPEAFTSDVSRGSATAEAIMEDGSGNEEEDDDDNSEAMSSSSSSSSSSSRGKKAAAAAKPEVEQDEDGMEDGSDLATGSVDTRRKQRAALKKKKKVKRRGQASGMDEDDD